MLTGKSRLKEVRSRSRSGQVRSGSLLGRSLGPWGPSEKKLSRANKNLNEGAQISNELESDRTMVMNLEGPGVDGLGYDETDSETEPAPSSTNPQ